PGRLPGSDELPRARRADRLPRAPAPAGRSAAGPLRRLSGNPAPQNGDAAPRAASPVMRRGWRLPPPTPRTPAIRSPIGGRVRVVVRRRNRLHHPHSRTQIDGAWRQMRQHVVVMGDADSMGPGAVADEGDYANRGEPCRVEEAWAAGD